MYSPKKEKLTIGPMLRVCYTLSNHDLLQLRREFSGVTAFVRHITVGAGNITPGKRNGVELAGKRILRSMTKFTFLENVCPNSEQKSKLDLFHGSGSLLYFVAEARRSSCCGTVLVFLK